jgi:membrane-associated protease RseP (regulator of RpoE activity)
VKPKHLILSAALLLCTGVTLFSQSKAESPDVVIPTLPDAPVVVTIGQTPGSGQAPQVWTFSSGAGDNYLGVYTEPVTSDNQNAYGLREARGVGISKVIKDSPAEKAGLQKDDVILRFDNEPVGSVRKLNRLIDEAELGHTAQLTISRKGAEQQVSVKLGKRSDANARIFGELAPQWDDDVIRPNGGLGGGFKINPRDMPRLYNVFGPRRRIGVGTSPLTKQLGEYFGVKDGGVLVSSVTDNGPAAKAGIRAGDIITEVDGNKINSAADLAQELGKKKEGEVTLTIIRDKSQRAVKVTPDANAAPSDLRVFDIPQVGELTVPVEPLAPLPPLRELIVPAVPPAAPISPKFLTPLHRLIMPPAPPMGLIL